MRTSLMVFVALAASAAADETISWRVVGDDAATTLNSEEPISWAVVGQCDCRAGGECTCGLNCSCRPTTAAKPVVFAYKDFNLICPGCIRLDQQAAELPVQLRWKQAPAWVQSYPTLHWQGENGQWYQYRWGRHVDDETAFRRAWESTRVTEGG